jgi:uncharacterized membrane protein YhaH (DUF805 family)
VPEPGRKSYWKPWLIVFVSGIVLAGSSCAGFMSVAMGGHELRAKIFADGFYIGVVATLVGALVLFVLLVVSVVRGISRGPS